MARTIHALLCIIFLATFTSSELGCSAQDFGWIQFLNTKDDMSFRNAALFANDTKLIDLNDTLLRKGTPWRYEVLEDTTTVESSFKMANASGNYYQVTLTWANYPTLLLPNPCAKCYWSVDEHGFSVVDLVKGGQPQFIATWNGPYLAS